MGLRDPANNKQAVIAIYLKPSDAVRVIGNHRLTPIATHRYVINGTRKLEPQ